MRIPTIGRASVLLLLLAACGGGAGSPTVVAAPIASAPPPQVAAEEREIAVAAKSDGPACTLRAAHWPSGNVSLRFRAGARPFAIVSGGTEVAVALPSGKPAAGALLELNASEVIVRGNIAEADVPLKPAQPFVVQGILIPEPGLRLVWESGAPGALDVSFALDASIRLAAGGTRSTRPCNDVTLDGAVTFDASAAIGAPLVRKPAELVSTSPVPLATDAAGPPVAHIDVAGALGVEVLEVRGASSRVTWSVGRVVVFGWVPTSATKPPPTFGIGYGTGRGGGTRGIGQSSRWRFCPRDVPFLARVEREERAVGTVRAGVALDVGERDGARVRVTFPTASVRAAEGAMFLLDPSDLEGCSRGR